MSFGFQADPAAVLYILVFILSILAGGFAVIFFIPLTLLYLLLLFVKGTTSPTEFDEDPTPNYRRFLC